MGEQFASTAQGKSKRKLHGDVDVDADAVGNRGFNEASGQPPQKLSECPFRRHAPALKSH